MMELAQAIEQLWGAEELDPEPIEEAVARLDAGDVRVAERGEDGWLVNEWVKQAILLYFRLRKVEPMEVGGLRFLDKIPVKSDYAERGVRVVPPGVARYGSFLSEGVVLMPGFVNIGAWVGPRTMVDTWATVGRARRSARTSTSREASASAACSSLRKLARSSSRTVRSSARARRGRRCPRRSGRGPGAERRAHRVDPGDRRHGPLARGASRLRAAALRRPPGNPPRRLPGRSYELPCALIVGAAQRVDGPQDLAQRRPPRVRVRDVTAVAEVALFTDDVAAAVAFLPRARRLASRA